MSHIFDALQRSEGEHPVLDSPAPSEATELLRRAERRTSSNWETAALLKKKNASASAVRDTSLELQPTAADPPAQEASAANEHPSADRGVDVFSQFRSLQVTLPAQTRLVCFTDEESLAAEAFRLLGVRLRHLRRDRPLRKLLITSTIPQEGKSTVAANLACTLAATTGQKILLLEGDLRRPSISNNFGFGKISGLREYLKGECALTSCIYHFEGPGFWVFPAGSAQSNALELLQSQSVSALMDQMAALFDWIIIDSPPLLPLADTSVWARLADGILLVTRQGITEKRHLQRGLEALEPKKLIGVLLNSSQSPSQSDYYFSPTNVAGPIGESTR